MSEINEINDTASANFSNEMTKMFTNISDMSSLLKENLEDAYQAVDKADAWEWLKKPETPGPEGFMWSSDPVLYDIRRYMTVDHSGGSFAEALRHMECIAKNGWVGYLKILASDS